MISNPIDVLWGHRNRHGPTFRYSFGGVRDAVVSSDPEIARHILKTNHGNYHKSPIQTSIMCEFLGEGLLTDRWEKWRPKRQRLARAFHTHALDQLAPTLEAALDEALDSLESRAVRGSVGLKDEVTLITFAMTARSFFGISFPLSDIARLSALIRSIQGFMTKLVVMPFLRPWWWVTGELARHHSDRGRGDGLLLALIKARMAAGPAAPGAPGSDLLDILLDMADPATPEEVRLTVTQVLAEAMQILVAGHETSSNAFTWLMLLLDANPEARATVATEFADLPHSRLPVFSDLAKLPRTKAIVEESLRLWPPFWMVDRLALADDEIAGVPIRRGTTVILFLYGLHRDPALWPAAESFCADRFDDGLWQHRDFLHLPFGGGPRRCIGVNYAKLQIITLLYRFLDRFSIEFVEGNTPGIDPKFILSPKGPVPVRIRRYTVPS